MGEHILDELSWRGLIAQTTDPEALRRELDGGPVTLYCGFDPTAPSLHAGNLVPLLTLRRFQQAGHRPIVLAGGATGMIGDPNDTGERTLRTSDVVADWAERIISAAMLAATSPGTVEARVRSIFARAQPLYRADVWVAINNITGAPTVSLCSLMVRQYAPVSEGGLG